MDDLDIRFAKGLACVITMGLVAVLLLFLGLKMIDYHFPSKFDKLIHCNK